MITTLHLNMSDLFTQTSPKKGGARDGAGHRKKYGGKSPFSELLKSSKNVRVSLSLYKRIKSYAEQHNLPMLAAVGELFGESYNPPQKSFTPIEYQSIVGERDNLLKEVSQLKRERDSAHFRFQESKKNERVYRQELSAMHQQAQFEIDEMYKKYKKLEKARQEDRAEIERLAKEYNALNQEYLELKKLKDKPVKSTKREKETLQGEWEKVETVIEEWSQKINNAPQKNSRFHYARGFLSSIEKALGKKFV